MRFKQADMIEGGESFFAERFKRLVRLVRHLTAQVVDGGSKLRDIRTEQGRAVDSRATGNLGDRMAFVAQTASFPGRRGGEVAHGESGKFSEAALGNGVVAAGDQLVDQRQLVPHDRSVMPQRAETQKRMIGRIVSWLSFLSEQDFSKSFNS